MSSLLELIISAIGADQAAASVQKVAASQRELRTAVEAAAQSGVAADLAQARQQLRLATLAQTAQTQTVPALARVRDSLSDLSATLNDKLSAAVDGGAKQLLALGAAALGVHQIYSGFKESLGAGADYEHMSRRVGESVRELVVLDQAFVNSGLGRGQVAQAANFIDRALGGVNEQGGRTDVVFRRLGVTIAELRALPFSEQLRVLQEKFSAIQPAADRAKIALDLFGRAGGQMLQVLADPSAMALAEEMAGRYADRLGRGAKVLEDVDTRLGVIKLRFEELFLAATEQLLPALHSITDVFMGMDLSAVGTIFGASGPTAAGGLLALWGIDKLDLALLNAQERFGAGMRGTMAGIGAQFTGALAKWLPVGLAAAIAVEITAGIATGIAESRLQAEFDRTRAVSAVVDPFRKAAAGANTDADAAKNLLAAQGRIAQLVQQRAALEEKQHADEASFVNGVRVAKGPGFTAEDARQLAIVNDAIPKLAVDIVNHYANAAATAQDIAHNQLLAIKEELRPLVAELPQLRKAADQAFADTLSPRARADLLSGRRASLEEQLRNVPAGLTDDEQLARRLDLERQLDEIKKQQQADTLKLVEAQKKEIDARDRRALFDLENQMLAAQNAGDEARANQLKRQIEFQRQSAGLDEEDIARLEYRQQLEDRRDAKERARENTRRAVDEERRALERTLAGIRQNLAQLEGDYTRTEAQKWQERKNLLQREVDNLASQKKKYEQQRDSASDPVTHAMFDQRATETGDRLAGVQGEQARLGASPSSWLEQTKKSLTDLLNTIGTTSQRIGRSISSSIGGAFDSASQHITAMLTGAERLDVAMGQIGLNIEQTIIGSIVDMGVRWVEQLAIMGVKWLAMKLGMAAADKATASASTAALVPIALAQSAIWAGPATLATIASFGAAAAAAPAEITAAKLATLALAAVPGARTGGYFPGADDQVAGVFHGNEFIFSAPAVRAIGPENLAAQHAAALRGGSAPAASSAGGSSSGGRMGDVHLYLDKRAYLAGIQNDMRAIAREVYAAESRR